MYPDLIDIGFLHIKTYGALMATGFLVCWWLVERLSGRKDLSNLLMLLMIGGVVGSRTAYVIEHWQAEFASNPMSVVRVDQGGLMFYGGFILSFVVFFAWCFFKREHPLRLADLLSTVMPLGHAFGRVGCFFYGCCYGRDSDAWCAVTFPAGSPSWHEHGRRMVSVLPTQLFEAAADLCLFAVLLCVFLRNWKARPGFTTGCYLVGYACIRFGIEFLRDDMRQRVGSLSIGQTVSIGLFVLGIAFILVSVLRSRAENCKIIGPTN